MAEAAPDKRQDFFRSSFEEGLSYEEFLERGKPEHREKWEKYQKLVDLRPAHREVLSGFVRKINVLVLAGLWCGDCARQCPMLRLIAETAGTLELRFLDSKANAELAHELHIVGGSRVPMVVSLSEDFFEVNRFGDRTLTAYRKKAERELGAACDPGLILPTTEELLPEVDEWVNHFERIHLMLRTSSLLRSRYND